MIDLNRLAASALSGALTGAVVGGLGARLAMRGVALIGRMEPSFTLGGTLVIGIMGAILGLLGGVLLGLVWRWLPGRALVKGATFGGIVTVLVAILFLRVSGGELDLAAPPVRAALFAWIPLVWGVATGWLYARLEPRLARANTRQVGLGQLGLFGLCLIVAMISMFTLASESLSLPPLMARFLGSMGWVGYRNAHALAVALFALAYAGLCTLLFWHSGGNRAVGQAGALATMSLLLFAAGFMQSGRALTNALDFLGLGQALTGLLRATGLRGLLASMLLWSDGVFRPAWGRLALAVWGGIWLLVWFVLPLFGFHPIVLPEPVLLLAVAGGLLNSLIVLKIGMPSFFATLGTSFVITGCTVVLLQGRWVYVAGQLPLLAGLGSPSPVWGIPWNFMLYLALVLLGDLLIRRSRLGPILSATGDNRRAADVSGINTTLVKTLCFVFIGVCSAFAGMLVMNVGTAADPEIGTGWQLWIIAIAVIGGCSFSGGVGSIIGGMLGTILIMIIRIGLAAANVQTNAQGVVVGAILVAAAILDVLRRRVQRY